MQKPFLRSNPNSHDVLQLEDHHKLSRLPRAMAAQKEREADNKTIRVTAGSVDGRRTRTHTWKVSAFFTPLCPRYQNVAVATALDSCIGDVRCRDRITCRALQQSPVPQGELLRSPGYYRSWPINFIDLHR